MSDTSLLTELITIDQERKRLKEELEALNDARKEIQEQILTEWEESGTTDTEGGWSQGIPLLAEMVESQGR